MNHTVARLLNKMLIRFTKSRARHTNDNGLVETKNGSVVRKQDMLISPRGALNRLTSSIEISSIPISISTALVSSLYPLLTPEVRSRRLILIRR